MMPQGYCLLILEMLLLTRSDLKIRAKNKGRFYQMRQDAIAFINTEWFESLCISVSLDPDAVRDSFHDAAIQHRRKWG